MGLELKSLSRTALLGVMARQLGMRDADAISDEISVALIAGVVRRIATTTCPCPRHAIVGAAVDALIGFGDIEEIKQRVREVLDSLIVIGDLFELGGSMSLPGVVAEDWLYCAPPAFVVREGAILLLGIEPEDHGVLPASLRSRVVLQRELRYIRTLDDERIEVQLHAVGYLEISKASWTRLPQNQTVDDFLGGVVRRLHESDCHGDLEGLQVYGPTGEARHFASRLVSPAGRSGYYVGRRPQAFGSPIWVFVELDQGRPTRFLDLPFRSGKFRGCDYGWRIQSALDAKASRPQTYRVVPLEGGCDRYEFFTPLPLWIERRLMIHGEKVQASGALFAYAVDCHCGHDIDDLVQSYMWFKKTD